MLCWFSYKTINTFTRSVVQTDAPWDNQTVYLTVQDFLYALGLSYRRFSKTSRALDNKSHRYLPALQPKGMWVPIFSTNNFRFFQKYRAIHLARKRSGREKSEEKWERKQYYKWFDGLIVGLTLLR